LFRDPDPALSPRTGLTRAHWLAVADSMLTALRPHASPACSLIDLPGPASVSGRWCDGLEGFARSFLLAAWRIAGDPGDPAAAALAERYARGLAAGTDLRHPERWPLLTEKAQAKVECASIAIALHVTRALIWDRLDDRVREQIVAWMAPMIGTVTPNNNWIWFQSLTEAFLRSVGGPFSEADLARNAELTESWYAGDGWYSDGDFGQGGNRNFDYYNGWALHFYPLWYCRMTPGADDGVYRDRLRRYLADAGRLIAADGAPLLHGRSATYRLAMLAPFWMGEICDATPMTPGATRRAASGVLKHFAEHGAMDDGILRPGWHRAFPLIRQSYSGPGSPYWASKGFAGLMLPADHPVWTSVEEPLPIEEADVAVALHAPGWLISGTTADGVVRMVNHGADHAHPGRLDADEPVYDRYLYSTHTSPELAETDASSPVDAHVALVADDGRASVRRPYERLGLVGRSAVSRHCAHWPIEPVDAADPRRSHAGPLVTCASVLRGAVEVRLVRIEGGGRPTDELAYPPHPGPWRLRIGGAALASDTPLTCAVEGARASVRRAGDRLMSGVVGLRGLACGGVAARSGTNAMGEYSACPWVISAEPVAAGDVLAAAVLLGADAVILDAAAIEIVPARDSVTVGWPDGESDVVQWGEPIR
jgi:hypothetical protein